MAHDHPIEPFVWLQSHGGGTVFPNQLRGEIIRDARGYIRRELDKIKEIGYKWVFMHCVGGAGPNGEYPADQRELMRGHGVPEAIHEYYENDFARDLKIRDMRAHGYFGISWLEDIVRVRREGGGFDQWPIITDDDVHRFEEQIVWWKNHGMSRLWFDALARRAERVEARASVDALQRLLLKYGIPIGGEPLPLSREGGSWHIDEERARKFPTVVTELALSGMSNNQNFKVPAGAVVYNVMRPQDASALRIRKRQRQGFIVCPWSSVDANVQRSMLKQAVGSV